MTMWKLLAQSVQGSGHKRLGVVCQDACLAQSYVIGQESVLILTVADGAGSAEISDVGSRLACENFHRILVESIRQLQPLTSVSRDQAVEWYEQVRLQLEQEANRREVPIRQLACTLLGAVISDSGALLFQIGDGAIVIRQEQEFRPVFWPQSGEYANTTNFLTSIRISQDLLFQVFEGRIEEVALFTDGLQTVALNFASRTAHQPFFNPLFKSLHATQDPAHLMEPMKAFLESKNLADRTDDDLTLILASRIGPNDSVL